MPVRSFRAEASPGGSRIDLSWVTPTAAEFPGFKGVKILRRELTEPDVEDFGTPAEIHDDALTPAGAVGRFSDPGLKGETVYYYAIVAYDLSGQFLPPVQASALATTAYQTADELYRDLPALYQRYDTATPPDVPGLDPADRGKGQLRRLIEMFGSQFDLLRSFTGGMRNFSDIDRVDGALIPLLSDWIGWPTDFTLSLAKRRNEVRFAPHFYRTTGIAANLRATITRLTTWDAHVKEFVHNVFLTNTPEQLAIYEMERRIATWQPASPVTSDVAYEGRLSAVRAADGRDCLFYHVRQSVQNPPGVGARAVAEDRWHLWYKCFDQNGWLPARRLTFEGEINKYPAARERGDGSFWVFWSRYEVLGGRLTPQLRLQLLSAARPARPPRLLGSIAGPFAFADGDQLDLIVGDGAASLQRTVTVHREHFVDMAQATAAEVAALLNRDLPGVEVIAANNGTIVITSLTAGAASTLTLPASTIATKLGLAGSAAGSEATRAQLVGRRAQPFALADGDTLSIRVDGGLARVLSFARRNFLDISQATAAEVVAAINSLLPGVAADEGGRLKLISPATGETSSVAVDVGASTAAPALGLGATPPPAAPPTDDTEPAVLEDNAGNLWLFWSSRRDGTWKIWYNRFDGTSWGAAKPLTTGAAADREPAVVFDPAGKIWVFWSRQKADGRWNTFYRTTTKLDFNTLGNADWAELELTPVPADHDRREPTPVLIAADNLELYFSSNRADGWHIWSNPLTPTPASDTQITSGQFTRRAPVGVKTSQGVRLWFRGNDSQVYTSPSYPASQTIDGRYAGSTTVDIRNPAKIGLRGNLQDVLRYTPDTGRAEDDWYARDTVGIYLTPDTNDEKLIIRKRATIASVVRTFLPIQVRAVLIIQQVHPEFVYTYAQPDTAPPVLIGEQVVDTILSEVIGDPRDSVRDLVNFRFVRAWSPAHTSVGVLDLSVLPPDLSFRLFQRGVEEGG